MGSQRAASRRHCGGTHATVRRVHTRKIRVAHASTLRLHSVVHHKSCSRSGGPHTHHGLRAAGQTTWKRRTMPGRYVQMTTADERTPRMTCTRSAVYATQDAPRTTRYAARIRIPSSRAPSLTLRLSPIIGSHYSNPARRSQWSPHEIIRGIAQSTVPARAPIEESVWAAPVRRKGS